MSSRHRPVGPLSASPALAAAAMSIVPFIIQTVTARRSLPWLFLVTCLGFAGLVWTTPDPQGYDLSALVLSARLADSGRLGLTYEHDPVWYNRVGPSAREAARQVGFHGEPTPYLHPPLLSIAARPMASVRFPLLLNVWTVLSAAAFLAGAWLSFVWALDRRPLVLEWAGLLTILVVTSPARYALWLGQTTPFVFAFAMGALVAAGRFPRVAGVCMAVPAFLKLTPLLLVLPWLVERRGRSLRWFAGGFVTLFLASVTFAGFDANRAWVVRAGDLSTLALVSDNHQSLPAFLERRSCPPEEVLQWRRWHASPSTRLAVLAAGLGGAILVALRLAKVHPTERPRLAGIAAVLGMLILPGISWSHYFVFLLPAGLGAAHLARAQGVSRRVVAGFLGAAVVLLSRPILIDQVTPGNGIVDGPLLAALLVGVVAFLPGSRPDLSPPGAA